MPEGTSALKRTFFPVLQALPWPALLTDGAGRLVCVNREMEASGVVATGRRTRSLRDPLPEYAEALRGDSPWEAQEASMSRQVDGKTVHERVWLRPTSTGAVLIVVDETRLHELETEHAQTVRLASLGFMLAGVCHEVSNPLAAIYSMLQIIRSDPGRDPQMLRKGIDSISANVQRILEISRRLSGFSRVDVEQKRPTAVDTVIEETLVLVRHEHWFGNVTIEHHKDLTALVRAKTGELQQVFFNVLSNAVQVMECKGRILITTRRLNQDRVEVMVQDDGPGIRPEHLAKLFDPFFSTKPSGQGTGLGLTISN